MRERVQVRTTIVAMELGEGSKEQIVDYTRKHDRQYTVDVVTFRAALVSRRGKIRAKPHDRHRVASRRSGFRAAPRRCFPVSVML